MFLATWNLSNQVGRRPFRLAAARAGTQLGADVIVFTEYFPRDHHKEFCKILAEAGWSHQVFSSEPPERANRVLIASRLPLEPDDLSLPDFDFQFPANIVSVRMQDTGLRMLGVRVPAYQSNQRAHLNSSWDWLESTAMKWRDGPAVIIGDLNVTPYKGKGGGPFRRIREAGWTRAQPAGGFSFYGYQGRTSEIDHVLATDRCKIGEARYITATHEFVLANGENALSDHAALVARIEVVQSYPHPASVLEK